MYTNPASDEAFFTSSAYDAVEQSAKLLASHFHNKRISSENLATIVDLHNKCQLLLSQLELDSTNK